MQSKFYAVIELTVDHDGSPEEAKEMIGDCADYNVSYDESGIKIVDTEFLDVRSGDEL